MIKASGILLLVALLLGACKKDSFITSPDASISFSADTLHYDTVFTSAGSITQFVRLYNNNDQKLRVDAIEIGGGINSPFKINVDGFPGNASGIEILPNDSIYIFVSVFIDPSATNTPFILSDSLRVRFNGNERFVQLQAWGQNATFLKGYTVTGNETWDNDKPYVILDRLTVAENATLTLSAGCRLYFHADAPMLVLGRLLARGGQYDSTRITMQGDRLDVPYSNFPGAWPGIYFGPKSHDNLLEYTSISNAYQGLVTEEPSINAAPKIVLKQCIITNCFDAGILAVQSDISAENLLVSNCGRNIVLTLGGRYDFKHLTNVGFSNSYVAHAKPVLFISNIMEDNPAVSAADLEASFINSIFWGEDGLVANEIEVIKQGSTPFDVNFSSSVWKMTAVPNTVTANNMLTNQDPLFQLVESNRRAFDFRLKEGSPARTHGQPANILIDLDGKPRSATKPDAGAFEN
ncbi:MAG: hypothetical protein EOO04_19685 [Chitinophagaceae bacterium]|nr:MAG: hypothetical protein EOO04_19685 [Chitinophagaceae bacterium]